MRPIHLSATTAAFLLALAVSTAGAQPAAPNPAQPTVTQEQTATATVESVDQKARTVLLRGEDGQLLTVQLGPEVRNLAQVHPGDHVTVTYRESIAAAMARPGGPPVTAATVGARARPGEKPAGVAARQVRARVRIVSVDTAANTVTFVGPSGQQRVVALQDPRMQRFAATLKPGDDVDVTYTEALAVRVEAAKTGS